MSNINKKVFVAAVFAAVILLLIIFLVTSNFLKPKEQHLHGGGFKNFEQKSLGTFNVGVIPPKPIGESDIEN